ncbi:MAG TPA: LysR substrate-binding domain-containing protein [Candidatus Competibacter phosphatis]|jgi:LysR family hydrogen peroxide-inducible transcriptional activator|uniref:Hydrogen peroxide-inducible genes activator n=1 Tax=Candidatus Competibacter phosphatis TaxID=221280 RepID=A0ABX1TGA0_9GAMM|nr:hydrogen peroxide-inducible genes activator [Candidatus Competibacter phosphatis]NMQ18401.1 hydrogen peroxide-inducible genes activator [Candidatus Competibacter phosphatis]HMQ12816.1 LysR substrate-binding domain-containing protein [Candidatus Competibacter phosphatis]HMR02784.1 LysR substrate-binding domain-containing protein [Candidatus Competibacter phosphatis]
MTLNELRYIVAVARERHFGHAAESCHISQPTLSVAVRKLEDELGVTLFERGPGEMTVTPIGRRIVEQAQRVLEEAAVVRQLASQGQDDLVGMLRLGVIYTIGPYLLPHLIPRLHRRAPDMPLQIEESYTAQLGERLKAGDLDVLILSLPFDEPGVMTQAVYEEPFVVLMPLGHPLEAATQVDAATLARQDLLLLGPGHCFRDQVLRFCPECNRLSVTSDNMQRTLEGSSLETIRLMVATGVGITVLPYTSVSGYAYPSDLLSVRPFEAPAPTRMVALAWRKSFPRQRVIALLAEAIRACPLGEAVRLLE